MTAAPESTVALHPAMRAHNIISVASGKGGVGKTWTAITLSHALANAGKHTLLFDGDLGLANVDIQLGLMPRHDLGSVISGEVQMQQAIGHYSDGGFDILTGKSGSGALAMLSKERLSAVRD